MASSESERIPCPSCGKTYRWKPELANRKVVCKACQTEFTFPGAPAPEPPPKQPEPETNPEEDGLYDLASDPDEDRELPPAFVPSTAPPAEEASAPAPTEAADLSSSPEPAASSETAPTEEDPYGGEAIVHVSDAKKAARREEQRLAAAEQEAIRTWRDYKLVYIVLGVLLLLAIIYWAIYQFSDAMEDGLHNTMRPGQTDHFVSTNTPPPGD